MKTDLSNLKVGDWIWTIRDGWVKACVIDYRTPFPISAGEETYTIDGKVMPNDKYPSAFTEPPEGFNAEPKPCEFVKGQRVLVSSMGELWWRKYFSHEENGEFHCFQGSGTEWSSEGETLAWKYCIPAEEEE